MNKVLPAVNFSGVLTFLPFRLIQVTTSLLFVSIFSFMDTSYDEVEILYQSSDNRLSLQGASFLRKHFVNHSEPCKSISVVGGWVWRCTYSDYYTTYNCFRKCRGTIEAARLFLGLNKDEDCDSFTMVNGKKQSVCYPRHAAQIFKDHGAVIAIEIIREWP